MQIGAEDGELGVYAKTTGIATPALADALAIYPNPSHGQLTVENGRGSPVQLAVYNLTGKLMLEEAVTGAQAVVDLSVLEPGMYLVKMANTNGQVVKKISVVE